MGLKEPIGSRPCPAPINSYGREDFSTPVGTALTMSFALRGAEAEVAPNARPVGMHAADQRIQNHRLQLCC